MGRLSSLWENYQAYGKDYQVYGKTIKLMGKTIKFMGRLSSLWEKLLSLCGEGKGNEGFWGINRDADSEPLDP